MLEEFRFEDLTWPEVNDAVEAGRIPVLPVGTIEQHGPHLPLKIDRWTSTSIVDEAARRSNGLLLAMPPVSYGYTSHVMDFPGSMTIHPRDVHSVPGRHWAESGLPRFQEADLHQRARLRTSSRRSLRRAGSCWSRTRGWGWPAGGTLRRPTPALRTPGAIRRFRGVRPMPARPRRRLRCTWTPMRCAWTWQSIKLRTPTSRSPSTTGSTFLGRAR